MSFPIVHEHMHVYTDREVRDQFDLGLPIYFDTMIFRNLWKLHSNPRASLLSTIETLKVRTYLPYQVQVELHRQAYSDSVLNAVPRPGLFQSRGMLDTVRNSVLDEVAKVRPQDEVVTAAEIEAFRDAAQTEFDKFAQWFDGADRRIRAWLGEYVDVTAIRRGQQPHALLDEVARVFEPDHLLAEPPVDEVQGWRSTFLDRVNQDDPVGPGKTDRNKGSIDEAAGDYLLWREMIDNCKKNGFSGGFFFVTEEKKADIWEVQQNDRALRRVDPRIQREAIDETGGPMHVLTFDELLDLAVADVSTREMLSTISQDANAAVATWTIEAYVDLLGVLEERGHSRQRDVIVEAARAGGFITRAEIGRVLGWGDEKRYLTRFRMPADRAKADLVDTGVIGVDATDPLWAVYEGPGEAVGYAVPDAFAEMQLELDGAGLDRVQAQMDG